MICESCGYRNKNSAKSCRGCGAALGPKMSDPEVSAMLNRLSDRSDALTASPFEKGIGLVLFSLSLVNLLVCIFFSSHPASNVYAIFFSIFGGVIARYPEALWKMDTLRLRFYTHVDDLAPNDLWSFSRKVLYWVFFVFTIACTVFSLLA